MYVSYTAPHWPLHAPEETIEKYEDKFDLGWDRLRRQRYQRLTKMGLIDEEWALTERDPEVPAWENAENKAWQARRMAVYAAMVDRMDQGIGQMVEVLEETGQLENTLILFLSDNGGSLESFGWVENRTYADNRGVEPSASGEVQTSLYPRVTREGELERQPGHIVDLMATAVDLGNATYPDTVQGSEIRPMQGISLMPALQKGDLTREEPLFFEHRGNRALRDGKWKAVAQRPSAPWELYNRSDRDERPVGKVS
jgi:arylsulfatase